MTRNLRDGLLALLVWLTLFGSASATTFWGLTSDQHLVRFTSSAPGTILVDLAITGLRPGERVLGIEVLTSDGRLLAITDAGRFYSIDRLTGAAAPISQSPPLIPIPGNAVGFTEAPDAAPGDFLDIISDTGVRVRFWTPLGQSQLLPAFNVDGHLVASTTITDTTFNFRREIAIDSTSDMLVALGGVPGAVGQFVPIGPLGVDTADDAGMDTDPSDNAVYAALTVNGTPGLYTIDPLTGHATPIGPIAAGPITSLAVDQQGAPTVIFPTVHKVNGQYQIVEANATLDMIVHRNGDAYVAADFKVNNGILFPTPGLPFVPINEVVHFGPGEIEKHLPLTILDDTVPEASATVRVFTQEDRPDAPLSATDLTIIDDENQPPAFAITSPVFSQTQFLIVPASTDQVTLTGTLSDDEPGARLLMYNTSMPMSVVVIATTSSWSFDLPLAPGWNSMTLYADDARHATSQVQRIVIYRRTSSFSLTQVFAEGATGAFFDTDLLFANPNPIDMPVSIDFLREDGVVVPYALTVPAMRRVTLKVDDIPGLEATSMATVVHKDAASVIVERTMRWDARGYGASTEKAAAAPALTWWFAEGSQGFFSTFLLLVNPQMTSNEVTVKFLREQGGPVTKTYTMQPQQRLTIDAGSIPELVGTSFGMTVTFAQPGVAERAMYFGQNPLWTGGHESAGAAATSTQWYLAEGATGPFFTTFLLLANPSDLPADVVITYLPANGVPVSRLKRVPPNARLTVNIQFEDGSLENTAVGAQVTSSVPIVVERSQYWPFTPDQWYEAHNSFGVDVTDIHWGLAEGRVGGPEEYQTYILLANPGAVDAAVTLFFLPEHGTAPVTKMVTVPAYARLNLPVDDVSVPEIRNDSFGVEIFSNQPIMVERSMYSNAIGQTWAAGTNATATRLP